MKIGKCIGGLIILTLLCINAFGQQSNLDSLINAANIYQYNDTTKVNLLNYAAMKALSQDIDKSFLLSSEAKTSAEQLQIVYFSE